MYIDYLKGAAKIAYSAGMETLNYYRQDLDVEKKQDNSPLSIADKASNNIIINGLTEFNLPILSEESDIIDFNVRKNWEKYWLVDPLDGTKEFIKKSDEYTINIALVENNKPVLGVVYAPAKELMFYGLVGHGAFKIPGPDKNDLKDILSSPKNISLPLKTVNPVPVIIASKSHINQETAGYIEKVKKVFGQVKEESYGSSLKLCMVASGEADIYPRLGPTMEWDTAASQAIVEAAGQQIATYPEFKPMRYNKEDLLNPYFIVFTAKMKKAIIP